MASASTNTNLVFIFLLLCYNEKRPWNDELITDTRIYAHLRGLFDWYLTGQSAAKVFFPPYFPYYIAKCH